MKRLTYLFVALLFCVSSMAQTKMELAQQAMDNDDPASVIRYTTEHLNDVPKDAKALIMRAGAYVVSGDLANAFADANAAIKCWNKKTQDLTLSQLYLFRSFLYQAIEDDVAALADLNTAIKNGKKVAENYEERAKFYYERNEFALAEADYRTAAQLEPTNADYQLEISRCMLQQEHYDAAESHLQKLVKLYPQNEEAIRLYSLVFLFKEDYKPFVDLYIKHIAMAQRKPTLQPLYDAAQHEFAYTLKAVSAQIASSSGNSYWLNVRASLYRQHRQFTDALADLRRVEATWGDTTFNPVTLYETALCYDALNDFSQSVRYYTQLIDMHRQINMPDVSHYLRRGNAYCELGQYDKAIADCDTALSVSPDDAEAYYLRGWAHEYAKNNEAAFDDYNKSILFDETFAYAYLMRGEQYLRHRHDTIRAMQDFERVLELDTMAIDGSCRHYALMLLGKLDEAKMWMAQILTAEPDDAGNYYDAACLYARMGETDEAMKFLRRAFELGFRRFQHLEADDDMDNLRNRPDYQELVNQYKKEKLINLFKSMKP